MARQPSLKGMAKDKPIEVIEESAEAYSKSVSKLVTARTKCAEQKAALIKHLRDHGKETYTAENGKTYSITPGKEKITVSDTEEYPDGDEDEDGASATN